MQIPVSQLSPFKQVPQVPPQPSPPQDLPPQLGMQLATQSKTPALGTKLQTLPVSEQSMATT
jgi:hypothetical protein